MKIVLAPDSFKESMTAAQAVAAMERGVRRVHPDATCVRVPMADGGEGTAATVVAAATVAETGVTAAIVAVTVVATTIISKSDLFKAKQQCYSRKRPNLEECRRVV